MTELAEKIEGHRDKAYSYIRIFLGLALAARGIGLMINPEAISDLVSEEKMYMGYSFVAVIHLIGGLLLATGFLTRISAFFQIPVLLGAVFVVHKGEHLLTAGQSLELAIMVLFLLIIFLIFGSGPISLDKMIFKKH